LFCSFFLNLRIGVPKPLNTTFELVYFKVMSLKKVILLKIGSKEFQLPQMIGAFVIIIAVLMLINAGAVMFDSWGALKEFNSCVEMSGINDMSVLDPAQQLLAQMRYGDCKNSLYEITGAQVRAGQISLTSRQFWTALTGPISSFFTWMIVLLIGLFIYNNTSIIIPGQEIEVEEKKSKVVKKKK
jgi:hypothetical protein